MTILNTAQSLEIKGLTDTLSGQKAVKEAGNIKLNQPPVFASPAKDPNRMKRGPQASPTFDNNGERKRTKMDVVHEAQAILDEQTASETVTNDPVEVELPEVK